MNNPCRLQKAPVVENKYEVWILNHAHIIVPVLYVILSILIIATIMVVANQVFSIICHISATEANLYYYHMGDL